MTKSAEVSLELIQKATAFKTVAQDHVYEYLTRASDETIEMNIDGSGGAINFDYIVPAGTVFKNFMFSRINIVLVDGTIRWGQFGGLGSALANGLLFQVLDDNGVIQQHFGTDVKPIQANEDFIALAGIDSLLTPAAGDDALPVRFSIFKSGHRITMFPNWIMRAVVQDNLTGLSAFRMMVQGIFRRNREAQIS